MTMARSYVNVGTMKRHVNIKTTIIMMMIISLTRMDAAASSGKRETAPFLIKIHFMMLNFNLACVMFGKVYFLGIALRFVVQKSVK